MKFTKIEKKQLGIFILVAYGIPYLLGFLMWYGYGQGIDLSVFPNAQMMYPAAGVMLAFLITKKEDQKIPRRFYMTFLFITAALLVLSILSVVIPGSRWLLIVQYILIGGSVLCWVILFTEKKEKRAAYGLRKNHLKSSAFCVLLFVFLYFLRTAIAYAMAGQLAFMELIFTDSTTWIMLGVTAVNFLFVFIAFLGEEYGWRYYLQPLLQKRFGLAKGVLLLGVVWGLWHLPINFFYYSPGSGLASAAGQQITCITLGIFFAYAYMKTENIWVPVILHFANNNLVPIISGTFSANVLQNQSTTWESLIPALIINVLLFGGFLFTKPFRKKRLMEEAKE